MRTREKLLLLVKIKPVPFILYGIVILLWNCMIIFSALCLQSLFDTFGEMNLVSDAIYMSVFLLVLIYALRGATSFLVMGLECWSGFSVDAFIKLNVMDRIFDAYGAKFPNMAKGEILNIFRDDIDQIRTFLLQITELMALLIYFFGVLIVLFQINPIILLAILAVAFFSVFFIRLGYKKLGEYRKEMRRTDGMVTAFAGEVISAVMAVKMADKKQSILKYFQELGDKRAKASVKESALRQFLSSSNNFFYAFGEGLILLLAFQMIRDGSFSIGDFAIFTFLFDSISSVISSAAMTVVAVPQTEVAMNRLENLIDSYGLREKADEKNIEKIYQKSIIDKDGSLETDVSLQLLEIQNLKICAEDGVQILDKINFSLNRGTITVVTGRTATGKTMLLRAILGLYPMETGEIFWNGKRIQHAKKFFVPPIAAYTPQKPSFFSGSIYDNILLAKKREEDAVSIDVTNEISMAVLETDIKAMEQGVDTVIGVKGAKVSGGQRKRIALARMYAREAELYVIDDVSSALDVDTEKELWRQIKSRTGKTFLIVSNSRFALEIADQIVCLEDGTMEIFGDLEDATSKSDKIRKMIIR